MYVYLIYSTLFYSILFYSNGANRYSGLKRNGFTTTGIPIKSNEVWPYLPNFEPPEWNAEGTYVRLFVVVIVEFVYSTS